MTEKAKQLYSHIKRVNRPSQDWHRADIKAELEKRGWTLSRLSIEHDYYRGAVTAALTYSWPAMERIIADTLDLQPWEIWPSRYNDYGQPVQDGNPNMVKLSHAGRPRNVDLNAGK